MARPPLPLGSWGEIRTYYRHDGRWRPEKTLPEGLTPGTWKDCAQFRDFDGKTRQVERTGTSKTKATRALIADLKARAGNNTTTLTTSSRVHHAATLYLDDVRQRRAGTTYDRYEGRIRNYITPRMGELLLRECSAGRIKNVLDGIRRDNPTIAAETLRGIRACISGIMQVAIDHDVLAVNPVASVRKIEGGSKRAARAYDADELADFLTKMDADKKAKRADLPDLVRFLFGTGCRFGEALAVRWYDLNLTDEVKIVVAPDGNRVKLPPHSVFFNGNIVAVTGKGSVRNEGKTASSRGVLSLPAFLHSLLLLRAPAMAAIGAGTMEPVFPSGTLGWRHPSNVQRSVRRLRLRIGYPDFKTHVGRKTVATVLAEAGQSSRQIADQLRQSSIQTTEKHYIERGILNPDAAKLIDTTHNSAN
ncbi:tyrosine-type recombinase/integrase [Actinocrispum sp. NPDC049592]|uniref:site-specific integrase n=1 Tax=Actinocrispum sp. NPDC049592 TaxID=3154835 RepID=UPI00342E3F8B